MLCADSEGRIYDHPYYRMSGFAGTSPFHIKKNDLIRMPEFSKLFYIPDCPPIGIDPRTGKHRKISEIEINGRKTKCFAVAAFLEPGFVRSHLPAVDYSLKTYYLPMWGYTAVGFKAGSYYTAGFRVEYNHRWDPRNYDDRKLVSAIKVYCKDRDRGRLIEHLTNCAVNNHCFAAKNLFLGRWEAPIPVSRTCNARCLGCLSLQADGSCEASHQRIKFRPRKDEIVAIAVEHLERAEDGIVSFGQGCEGEPLTEYKLISESIKEIRKNTSKGTINLNTNGSWPDRVRIIAENGLDSIRISINSPRKEFYYAYYRPVGYTFENVINSISLSKEMGLYTMINYLVFPGISDQEAEIEAMKRLVTRTGINFIHVKNLNIDPQLYCEAMPREDSKAVGMKKMLAAIKKEFGDVKIGYFNQQVHKDLRISRY
ncbi:MAG: radical SAM protein [Deltaproteobacteria bacterium]|nr:radical SAM protein [Deltaproteobacteria bacterium]